jgi:hypothetical protein
VTLKIGHIPADQDFTPLQKGACIFQAQLKSTPDSTNRITTIYCRFEKNQRRQNVQILQNQNNFTNPSVELHKRMATFEDPTSNVEDKPASREVLQKLQQACKEIEVHILRTQKIVLLSANYFFMLSGDMQELNLLFATCLRVDKHTPGLIGT